MRMRWGFLLLLFFCITACEQEVKKFKTLSARESGIDFSNNLTETDSLNYFNYAYLYMGGGVSVGDINNDGLQDIYFTGNMVPNKLYLNQGDLTFKDITIEAGVQGDGRWYTGTTMADVNGDGLLDIYLSVSGKYGPRNNQLYINQGDLTFTEEAKTYGLDDAAETVQSTFWDYDRDGDLDVFLANYPSTSFRTPNSSYRFKMDQKLPELSDKLYRNEGDGKFVDVTSESGLLNFGLSVSATITDFNNDGWEDIYVSNDFSTPDYLYLNNGDGTFTDKLQESVKQTSFYGMGTDAADINNDGLVDLMQVDMAAVDNRRAKANMASMNPDLFWSTVNNGFHYQYMYNSLQLNRGVVEGVPKFSNVAWLAEVAATDWSWCPLFADFDNDGFKDLFVSNGTRKEINNRDFFKSIGNFTSQQMQDSALELSARIPEEPIDNFVFRNVRGQKFEQANDDWSLSYEGFSNGAAYADLDNDGDLDLVVNNLDDRSMVFENRSKDQVNFIQVQLEASTGNSFGLGAKVTLKSSIGTQTQYIKTSRGFQSSVAPIAHFGLGSDKQVTVIVDWPDGVRQEVQRPQVNQVLRITKTATGTVPEEGRNITPYFTKADEAMQSVYSHQENNYNDFYDQVLLPHKLSNFGPGLAKGDINGDGLDDFYVGNGAGFPGMIFQQTTNGEFIPVVSEVALDSLHEDTGALFFDADQDGDDDLYVVSGGNHARANSGAYLDRFYENDNGILKRRVNAIPEDINGSGAKVVAADIDFDGDLDLLVGGRLSPKQYPAPGKSFVLLNNSDANGVQFLANEDIFPDFSEVGMVTDILVEDFNGDKVPEISITGEWMPIKVFEFINGSYEDQSVAYGLEDSDGWWFSLASGDFDGDGDTDLVGGNLGLNYKYRATQEAPFDLYVSDFDQNQSVDLVLGYFSDGEQFPVRGRQCSSDQIPAIQLKFKDYHSFATATLADIYGAKELEDAIHLSIKDFSSRYFENKGNGTFAEKRLPLEAQFAPINDMLVEDINGDGSLDILLAGNLYASEVETPRADAGVGLVLINNGSGDFESLSVARSGLVLDQDVKQIEMINTSNGDILVAASNQGNLMTFQRQEGR